MEFDVFGRRMLIERHNETWQVYQTGDGKRALLHNVVVPSTLAEAELPMYLADLFHEWASPERPHVRRLR